MKEFICEHKKYQIYKMSSKDNAKEFYADMGYIFASRSIRKELDGYPIDNDANRMWIVAFLGDEVIGFRSYGTDKHNDGIYYDAWVREDCRRNGLYRLMLRLAELDLMSWGAKKIKAIGNQNSTPILQAEGFEIIRKRGRFNIMEKVIA